MLKKRFAAAAVIVFAVIAAAILIYTYITPSRPLSGGELNGIFAGAAENDRRVIMRPEKDGFIYSGAVYAEDTPQPFYDENGFSYFPLNTIAQIFGAKMYRIPLTPAVCVENKNGVKSYFITNTGIAACGSEIVFTDTILKRGSYYFCRSELIGKILNLVCCEDYSSGAVKFNSVSLSDSDKQSITELWGISGAPVIDELSEISEKTGVSYDELIKYAHDGSLYYNSETLELSKYTLNDRNELSTQITDGGEYLEPGTYYVDSDSALCSAENGQLTSAAPSAQYLSDRRSNELKAAYHRYKCAADLSGQDMSDQLSVLRAAITEDKECPDSLIESAPPLPSASSDAQWEQLCSAARPGDVILCNRDDVTMYGYNNHSAVILDITDKGELHLVHARSDEYGVGSDDGELDYLDPQTLSSNEYWQKTDRITLYRYLGISEKQQEAISEKGASCFDGYTFGYYGFLGKKEITCAELVSELYAKAGIEIGPSKSEMRKSLFNGKIEDAVFLPDSIMLSDKFTIIAFWQR